MHSFFLQHLTSIQFFVRVVVFFIYFLMLIYWILLKNKISGKYLGGKSVVFFLRSVLFVHKYLFLLRDLNRWFIELFYFDLDGKFLFYETQRTVISKLILKFLLLFYEGYKILSYVMPTHLYKQKSFVNIDKLFQSLVITDQWFQFI